MTSGIVLLGQTTQAIALEDHAGPYTIAVLDEQRDKKNGEIREFIWNHWKEHRLGTLTATWFSKEGVPSQNIFIFRQNGAVWSMRVRIEGRLSLATDDHDLGGASVVANSLCRGHQPFFLTLEVRGTFQLQAPIDDGETRCGPTRK